MIETNPGPETLSREAVLSSQFAGSPSAGRPQGDDRPETEEPASPPNPPAATWAVAVPEAIAPGAFSREAVEQAYRTAFGALRSYPDRYVQSLREDHERQLREIRTTADADVLAIGEQREARHAQLDAEASEAIDARHARLEQDITEAANRLHDELLRAEEEIAAFEAQLAGFEAQTAAFLERTSSSTALPVTSPGAAAEPVETPAEPMAATEAILEVEPEVPLEYTPELESQPAAVEANVEAEPAAEVEVLPAAEALAAVQPEAPEAPGAPAARVEPEASWTAAPLAEPSESVGWGASPTPRTTVAVRGLADVASIAAFMRLLTRAQGIRTVQVRTEGPGEVFFAVAHDPDADLTQTIRSLWPFEVRVLEAQPGSMIVTTRDPYAA